MLSYKLRNMPLFIMIAILLMACGNAAIIQPEQKATPQPEITPSPPTVALIGNEEAPTVDEQKEENLTQTPTGDVNESEEETSTSPLPTPAAVKGVMAEENVVSTAVTTTTATPPTNTTAVTATPVLTAGSEGWRAENIEAEGVVALDLSATLSAQSAQENGKYFLNPAISPDGRYLLIERSTFDSIPCYEGSDCLFSIGELWLYDFTINQWEPLVTAAIKGTWSSDGQRIAYLAQVGPGKHELQYLSLADRITHTVATDAIRSQLFWRDNQHLVYLGPGGYVTQIKVDGSDKQQLSSMQTNGEAVDFALSDNGASLAIVDNRDLWLVDLDTSQEPRLLSPEEEHLRYSGIVQGLAWSSEECPPNTDSIWVERRSYGDGGSYPINFEEGTATYIDREGRQVTVNNYVTGVLEGEIGTFTETGAWWDDDLVKAMTVAIRTIAYDWCGIVVEDTSDGQVGRSAPNRG